MGACGSAPVHHDHSHPPPVGRQRSVSQHGGDEGGGKEGEEEKSNAPEDSDDADDPASRSDSGNGDSDSENSQSFSHDPSQSQYGEVPVKRKKKKRGHRRNKSRTAHKKAQKALEERMRALKTDDLFETESADVIHSPIASARTSPHDAQPLSVTVTVQPVDSGPTPNSHSAPTAAAPAVTATTGQRLLHPSSSSSLLPLPTPSQSLFPFDPEEVTILVIDNDDEVCQCVEGWLSDRRYSVITCLEGREAVEVLLEAGAKDDNNSATSTLTNSAASAAAQHSRLPPSNSSNSAYSSNDSPSSSVLTSAANSSASASISSNNPSALLRNPASAAASDLCDIDMIVCDWHTSYQSQKFLDWVMDNPSLAHIPVIILADDEMTAQGMDRLMRRGAADILRKPLVHHPFIHSIQTIIKNKVEAAHVQLLRSKGDEYKQELNRAQKNSIGGGSGGHNSASSSLSTPKRSFVSMLNTFVTATPKGSVTLGSPMAASSAIQQVHAILVSGEEWIHNEVSAAVQRLPLTLHSCASPHESLLLQEDIDAQSNTSTILSHTSTQDQLMSPHFPSHFGFAASNLSSPNSRSTAAGFNHFGQRSTRVSIVDELATPTSHLPTNKKLSTAANTPHMLSSHQTLLPTPLSPRMSQSTNMRNSIIRNLHSFSSYFGTELFILDSAAFRGEEGAEWIRVMQARSQKQQTPVLLLTPESDPSTQLIRSLHPLQVVVVSVPLSSTLLVKKVSVLLESISIIRHQRLYAYRAQAYRMLVKKIREKKSSNGGLTVAGGSSSGGSGGSNRGVLVLSEGGTALNSRASVSMSMMDHSRGGGIVTDEDAMRSLLSSPTGMLPRLSITSPSVVKPSSRAVNGSLIAPLPQLLDISNQRRSEVMLQPFTQFPPPGLHNRRTSESVSSLNEQSSTHSHPLRQQSSATEDDLLSPHGSEPSQTEQTDAAAAGVSAARQQSLKRASSSRSPRLSPQQSSVGEGSSPNSGKLERTLNTLVGLARLDAA